MFSRIQKLALPLVLLSASASACQNSTLNSYTTTDGATYAYSYTPPQGTNSTYLLLHGYPTSHKDWEHQITTLTAAGFGALAPDMLGFGASDMPTEVSEYRAKRLSDHLAELLDYEELDTVIGVGHDWGAVIMSRLAVYHRERFEKLAWVDVGYQAPTGFADFDAFNKMGQEQWGYMPYGYWYFFDRYDAGRVLTKHVS